MRFLFGGLALLSLGCGGSQDNPQAANRSGNTGGSAGSAMTGGSGGSSGSSGSSMGGTGAPTGGSAPFANCGCVDPPGGGEEPPDDLLELTPGVWTKIGLPVTIDGGGGTLDVAFDPNNPWIIYAGMEAKLGGGPENGLYKSKNGGRTWTIMGPGEDYQYDNVTSYLDLPTHIRIDPCNSNHLYALEGVRGGNNGFWVSCDGGENWTRPPGFLAVALSNDMSAISVDPTDFKHVLLGSHDGVNAGVLETTNAGDTFTHHPAVSSWPGGSQGVNFLMHPETGKVDPKRWLVHNDGHWLTTDGGETWERKSTLMGVHGATTTYYTDEGVVYTGGAPAARSRDNGNTWETVPGMPNGIYYTIVGDGTNLHTMADNFPPPAGFLSSPESDGNTWTENTASVRPVRGPYHLVFDKTNRIMYAAQWDDGVYALKVP